MKTVLTLVVVGLLVSGCNCKPSYMPENFIVKPQDKNMNCQEVIYAINETEFWMKNVHERCRQPHVFSKFLPCTPMVKLDAMRNEYTLSDRANYLRSLYKIKGCEAALTLKGTTIEKQSNRIGYERNEMKIKRHITSSEKIIPTKGKVTTDIPSNL